MKLLVTGAGGLLGRAAVNLASRGHDCIGLLRQDLDVTDRPAVREAVHRAEPDAVIHCAAYTNVDESERNADLAFAVNAQGTEWVARAAREVDAQMVYVSTDYVFDGKKKTPYVEEDDPNPLSQYGRSKLDGEAKVRQVCTDSHTIVRSAWLYGPGTGFVDWVLERLEISERSAPLHIVDDQVGSPTCVSDLARAILLLTEERFTGTVHFANKGETSWLGAARVIADFIGIEGARLSGTAMTDLGRAAPRPRYSALDVGKFEKATGSRVSPWDEALKNYLVTVRRPQRKPKLSSEGLA